MVQGAGKQSHHPLPPKPGLFSAHSDRRLCQRLLFLTLTLLYTLPTLAQQLDMDRLKGIQARNIGPAGMSGRVTVASVVTDDPTTMYIGTASGGVWKSTSGGIHWEPIFDNQPAASIGDIAIYQKNPNIIWVGTGEGNPRNTQNMGNGVFRSMDGGKTWEHLGLESTRVIHRIIVHPENPDIVWVGSQGDAWGESTSRGVYKTTDGGESWDQVLYVNEKTGIADLVIDPNNPNKLMAAMWNFAAGPGILIRVEKDPDFMFHTMEETTGKSGPMKMAYRRVSLAEWDWRLPLPTLTGCTLTWSRSLMPSSDPRTGA